MPADPTRASAEAEAKRELLQSIVADRKNAGESLADVGRTLAKIIAPDHTAHLSPISSRHGSAGRTTIPDDIAQALHTYAALLDGAGELQARAHQVDVPILTVHDLPAHTVIILPPKPCALAGCPVVFVGHPFQRYCSPTCRAEATPPQKPAPPQAKQRRTQEHLQGDIVTVTHTATVNAVIESLLRRGFVDPDHLFDPQAMQTQVDAVIEELGELSTYAEDYPELQPYVIRLNRKLGRVTRRLRRHRQGREPLNIDTLSTEGADLVIAAICLLTYIAGFAAPVVVSMKLAADEKRGWLHSGKTRAEFEAVVLRPAGPEPSGRHSRDLRRETVPSAMCPF